MRKTITTSLRAACLLAAAEVQGAVIYDGFDPGQTFHPQNNLAAAMANTAFPGPTNALRAAVRFTVNCGNYHLTAITLPIGYSGADGLLRVRLAAEAGGLPGPTLEILSQNQNIWPVLTNPFTNKTTLVSGTTPLLSEGSNYWIVTEPTGFPASGTTVDYRWFYSTNGPFAPVRQQQSFYTLPTDPWTGITDSLRMAFRVEGTPVNLPSLSVRLSQVELCWDSCTNVSYQVQFATNLNATVWQNLGSPFQGNGSRVCTTDAILEGQPRRYYRLNLP